MQGRKMNLKDAANALLAVMVWSLLSQQAYASAIRKVTVRERSTEAREVEVWNGQCRNCDFLFQLMGGRGKNYSLQPIRFLKVRDNLCIPAASQVFGQRLSFMSFSQTLRVTIANATLADNGVFFVKEVEPSVQYKWLFEMEVTSEPYDCSPMSIGQTICLQQPHAYIEMLICGNPEPQVTSETHGDITYKETAPFTYFYQFRLAQRKQSESFTMRAKNELGSIRKNGSVINMNDDEHFWTISLASKDQDCCLRVKHSWQNKSYHECHFLYEVHLSVTSFQKIRSRYTRFFTETICLPRTSHQPTLETRITSVNDYIGATERFQYGQVRWERSCFLTYHSANESLRFRSTDSNYDVKQNGNLVSEAPSSNLSRPSRRPTTRTSTAGSLIALIIPAVLGFVGLAILCLWTLLATVRQKSNHARTDDEAVTIIQSEILDQE